MGSQAIAVAWAQAGAAGLVLVGRKAAALEATEKNVVKASKSVSILIQTADVSDESSVKALFAKVKERFGRAHVLINATGAMGGGLIGDASLASWWNDFVSDGSLMRILKADNMCRKSTSKGLSCLFSRSSNRSAPRAPSSISSA